MGKYMRKPKITSDTSAMEVVSPMGVRTRAKTLALKKLLQSPPDTSSSYLQLRSRTRHKLLSPQNPSPRKSPNSTTPLTDASPPFRLDSEDGARIGENYLEFEGRERSTRESTPCSFIRESTTAETPAAMTREISSTATNQRTQITSSITQEIEEFFASAEKQQQNLFAERYNFDVVNDVPLPGRYEWVRVEN